MPTFADLPFELREHVSSYLQEELYVPAFTLLQNILVAGAECHDGSNHRIFIPSPQILALASTLIVYPPLTTRLPSKEKTSAADLAGRYLQHLKTVPHLSCRVADAFVFASSNTARQARPKRRNSIGISGTDHVDEFDGWLTTRPATTESIFEQAEDFWSVVGWAFNCSIKHPGRWQRWRVWLEVMLDIHESDLDCRLIEMKKQGTDCHTDMLSDTLLSKYVYLRGSGRGEKKRIVRAILADGSKQSLNEFHEVWKFETKPHKEKESQEAPPKILDVDNDEWADYMDNPDDIGAESGNALPTQKSSRSRRSVTRDNSDEERSADDEPTLVNSIDDFGGISSMVLRQRILGLLLHYTEIYPGGFMKTNDLIDIYTEIMRPQPLHIFTQLVSPTIPWIRDPDVNAFLLMDMLCIIVGRQPPAFRRGLILQDDLEKHYLPATASGTSVVDNAKVSIMVEALLRLMWRSGLVEARPSLTAAVRKGGKERANRVAADDRRKTHNRDVQDRQAEGVMANSFARMMAIIDVMEVTTT